MKYSFLSLGMIFVGMIGLVFISTFESITINNESEYYSLKEAMEASMLEAVDLQGYRLPDGKETNGCNGRVKISEQKFVENFVRRFGNTVTGDAANYKIDFYDIMESPPKATVVITGVTDNYSASINLGDESGFNIKNALTGILEEDDSFE